MGRGIWKKVDLQLQHKIMKIDLFCKGDVKASDDNYEHFGEKQSGETIHVKKLRMC